MDRFLYLYDSNHNTDMELQNNVNGKTAELERLCKQFLETVESQEKQGFPCKSYLKSKKKAFMLDVDFLLRSV
jgi:hypothetical protein